MCHGQGRVTAAQGPGVRLEEAPVTRTLPSQRGAWSAPVLQEAFATSAQGGRGPPAEAPAFGGLPAAPRSGFSPGLQGVSLGILGGRPRNFGGGRLSFCGYALRPGGRPPGDGLAAASPHAPGPGNGPRTPGDGTGRPPLCSEAASASVLGPGNSPLAPAGAPALAAASSGGPSEATLPQLAGGAGLLPR